MSKPPALAGLRILLVDDDQSLASFLKLGLTEEACDVSLAFDGGTGLRLAESHPFDLILLDVMLPVINGVEVARRLRLKKCQTPIILLTARSAPDDIVQGLDAGADDYLAKPFIFEVLLARIRARTRSPSGAGQTQARFADLVLDADKHEAFRGSRRLDLTQTEFAILECLIRAAGRVVTRARIIDVVWGDREVSENNLDVFIRYLRTKVDESDAHRLIHTERGLGYCLKDTLR